MYNQPITTEFVCKYGQLEYFKALYDLKNIPVLYRKLADMIFKGLKWSVVNVFFDDTYVFSKTEDDHVRDVALVLLRFIECGFTISPGKFPLTQSLPCYLTHICHQRIH